MIKSAIYIDIEHCLNILMCDEMSRAKARARASRACQLKVATTCKSDISELKSKLNFCFVKVIC